MDIEPGHHPHRRHLGIYEPAVQRWERLTRPAPEPADEQGRLRAPFVEWMMGLPEGWVTDVVSVRRDAIKILGNGVVPQQAAYALAGLWDAHLAYSQGEAA